MIVDITWLQTVHQRLREVNDTPLDDIVWVKDGKKVKFSEDDLIQFQYIGMNNTDLYKLFPCEEAK